MTSHDEQRLGDALRRRAEAQDPQPLSFDDVTARAGGIRRRRAATGIAAAVAAVAAVVVPTSAVVIARDDGSRTEIATATPNPTVTGGPTESPTDQVTPVTRQQDVPLLGDLPSGDAPRVAVLVGDEVLTPDGARVPVGADTVYAAYVGGSVVTVERVAEEQGAFRVRDLDGTTVLDAPASIDGALSVTPDRTAAAYVDPEGRIHTWTASDGDREMSGPIENIRLGPMTGSQTCGPTAAEECRVVFGRGTGGAGFASSTGASAEIPGFLTIDDSAGGLYAGQTESSLDGSCSQLRRVEDNREVAETCDHTFGSFSADGAFLVGGPPYLDGLCCAAYDVLDTGTLEPLLTLHVRGGAESAYIAEVGWEDDSHVLATVFDGEEWRIVRVALDGTAELVDAGPLPSSDLGELPLRLDAGA